MDPLTTDPTLPRPSLWRRIPWPVKFAVLLQPMMAFVVCGGLDRLNRGQTSKETCATCTAKRTVERRGIWYRGRAIVAVPVLTYTSKSWLGTKFLPADTPHVWDVDARAWTGLGGDRSDLLYSCTETYYNTVAEDMERDLEFRKQVLLLIASGALPKDVVVDALLQTDVALDRPDRGTPPEEDPRIQFLMERRCLAGLAATPSPEASSGAARR